MQLFVAADSCVTPSYIEAQSQPGLPQAASRKTLRTLPS